MSTIRMGARITELERELSALRRQMIQMAERMAVMEAQVERLSGRRRAAKGSRAGGEGDAQTVA